MSDNRQSISFQADSEPAGHSENQVKGDRQAIL